jgi:hypothetical protein
MILIISTIYYTHALAVDVHCSAADQSGSVVCLFAEQKQMIKQLYSNNYTCYPFCFYPAYGNLTSDRPPGFLDHNLFTIMKSNISH